MGRIKAFAIAFVLAALLPRASVAAGLFPDFAAVPCAKFTAVQQQPGMSQFFTEYLHMGAQYHWFGEHPGVDMSVMTPDAQVQYLREYCGAHPSDALADAYRDLLHHIEVLNKASGHVSPAAIETRDLEAPADVRAYVLTMALPLGLTNIEGVLDNSPDLLPGLVLKLAKDKDGKIRPVPDLTMIAFNDTGAAMPEFSPDFRILAAVYPRRLTHDRPPSGNEDHDVADGIPVFYIGSRGRDVWEIGKTDGVVSVRLDSAQGVGPWEKFQKVPSNYRYYSQHILNGRTVDQDFVDPKVAALVRAACSSDKDAMARALKAGADPNGKGIDGDTPIFWALDCDNLVGLEALLKAGADPNYRVPGITYPRPDGFHSTGDPDTGTTHSYSVLFLAVRDHLFPAVRILLKYGADPGLADNERIRFSTLAEGLTDQSWEQHKSEMPGWDLPQALLDADKSIARGCNSEPIVDHLAVVGRYDLVEEFLKRGYGCELPDLAWTARMRFAWDPQDDSARLRVNEILKERGVLFPPHNRFERWAELKMQDDGSLLVHWGDLHSRRGALEPDQTIRKGEPHYDELIARVGGLKPGEEKHIERRADDAKD